MTCPSCRADVPGGARFCPSCGHQLVLQGDERRVATVVFADVVGYTALSEGRDPEHVKNMLDRCFAALVDVVLAFGGRVDKIVGDAIVALFGAPVAHEDDAERAVRAALQMQQILADLATGTGGPGNDGEPMGPEGDVRLRIGVNTGEVVVGALRSGGDYTALGDVVNVAARLQTAALPGQVLVGPSTYGATREVFEYEDLGLLQARGRDEPVQAWRAVQAVVLPGRRPRRMRAPLVGREHDDALLRHALRVAVDQRRACLVLLVGDAGVGKSRLAEELGRAARTEHHAVVLEGRCVPYGEANLWWPVAEILRQALGIEVTDGADTVATKARDAVHRSATGCDDAEQHRIADGLLYLLGHEGALGDVEPTRAREEAVRAAQLFAQTIAERSPLVLVVSELHWADPLVLDFLDRVLDRLRSLPVVIVATARPEVEERWTPRPGRHNLVALSLEPLGRDAAAAMVEALAGPGLDPMLREAVLDRSGGNPFFLEELVNLLKEAGVLDGGGSSALPMRLSELPATLRGLVAARIDALDRRERAVLEDAAVMGRAGWSDGLVAMAAARGDAGAEAVIDALVAKDLLVVADGECGFRSDLVREVAYETLTKGERARRHAAVAEWLEGRARRSDRESEHVEAIAHHYGTAAELAQEVGGVDGIPGDIRHRAVATVARAAERAEGRETLTLSARLFDQALRLSGSDGTDGGDGGERRRLLLGRARVRVTMRDFPAAHADVDAVLAEARASGDRAAEACGLVVRGDTEQKEGDLVASTATLEEARRIFGELGDRHGEANALRTLGMTMMFAGRLDEAIALVEEALTRLREVGDRPGVAWALQNLAWVAFDKGDPQRAEQWLNESVAVFRDLGDFGGLGWALGLLAWVRFYQGDLDDAADLGAQVRAEAHERGDAWGEGMMLALLAHVRVWQGWAEQAVELGATARRLFVRVGDTWGEIQAILGQVQSLAISGRAEECRAVVGEGLRLSEGLTDPSRKAVMLGVSAAALLHLGDPDEAEAVVRSAGVAIEEGTFGWGEIGVTLALHRLQKGDAVEALDLLRRIDADSDGHGAWLSAVTALAAAAAGDAKTAVERGEAVADMAAGTYLDRFVAALGLAFGQLQLGRIDEMRATFGAATASVDATEAALDQALARLAWGRAEAAVGGESAEAARLLADGRSRLARIRVAAGGWERAFTMASRPPATVPA